MMRAAALILVAAALAGCTASGATRTNVPNAGAYGVSAIFATKDGRTTLRAYGRTFADCKADAKRFLDVEANDFVKSITCQDLTGARAVISPNWKRT